MGRSDNTPDLTEKLNKLLGDAGRRQSRHNARLWPHQLADKTEIKTITDLATVLGVPRSALYPKSEKLDGTIEGHIRAIYSIPETSVCWKMFLHGEVDQFELEYEKLYGDPTKLAARTPRDDADDPPLGIFDDILAAVSLWLSQEKIDAADGTILWPVSFGIRSQPSPAVIDGKIIVLKRVKVFLSAETDGVLWHEAYAATFEPEGANVVLRSIGDNTRPGRLVEGKSGGAIEHVDVPHDFFRVSGLWRGTIVKVWIAAYSKDLAMVDADSRLRETADGDERISYSFAQLDNIGKQAELASREQQCLLKVIDERQRRYRMGDHGPRMQPGWVLLHWVSRPHPYAPNRS